MIDGFFQRGQDVPLPVFEGFCIIVVVDEQLKMSETKPISRPGLEYRVVLGGGQFLPWLERGREKRKV